MKNRGGLLKQSVLGFGAKTFFGAMVLAVMGYALFLTAFANESNQIWEALKPWLIFWRLGLLMALIGGWLLFDRAWEVMTDTGLCYLPFIGMLLKNSVQPMYKQDLKEASLSSLRSIELDIFCMLTVVVLATQPMVTLDFGGLSYTKACSASSTAAKPGNTRTAYDQAFTTATLGGNSVQVPVWWYGVLALAAGFDDAVVAAIPCSGDIRLTAYQIQNSRIKDPRLRREVQLFTNDCYAYALSRYLETDSAYPSPYPPEDLYWLGSSEFGIDLYNRSRASEPIPGFPFKADRDLEYDTQVETPPYGKPTCNEWWSGSAASDPKYGLRQALANQIETSALTGFKALAGSLAGKSPSEVEEIAIKTLVSREKAYFNGLHDLQAYNDRALDILNSAAGTAGAVLESWSFYPKLYMVKALAPILQASVLMVLFALLPLVIVCSSYDIGVMVTMSVVIFSVKFWSVLWAIAHWLDNHLIVALEPGSWYQLDVANNLVPELLVNFVTGLMFIGLPVLWAGALGWAGFKVGNEISGFTSQPLGQGREAGASGSRAVGSFAGKMVRK